jgi:hypothetical protein
MRFTLNDSLRYFICTLSITVNTPNFRPLLVYQFCRIAQIRIRQIKSMQSVSLYDIINGAVHDEVYSIQHYVIKLVSDLWQNGGFLRVFRFPPLIKLTAMI